MTAIGVQQRLSLEGAARIAAHQRAVEKHEHDKDAVVRCEIEQRLVAEADAADKELNRITVEQTLVAEAHAADAAIEAEMARREEEARARREAMMAALREKIERGFVEVIIYNLCLKLCSSSALTSCSPRAARAADGIGRGRRGGVEAACDTPGSAARGP